MKTPVLYTLLKLVLFFAGGSSAASVVPSLLPASAPLNQSHLDQNNSKTSPGYTSESSANVVSWQSACWTLIALSLNAMTQPSAADHVISASTLSPARSSPFICLADILVTLIWTITGWVRGAPLSTTPALARYHLKVNHEDPFEELKNGMPSVGITFFVLGPLPQAVKLWGMHGLPLTQAMGSVYMMVYLLTLLTSLCPTPKKNYEATTRVVNYIDVESLSRLSRGIYFAAFAVQAAAWIWVLFLVAGYFVNDNVALSTVVIVCICLWATQRPVLSSIGKFFIGTLMWLVILVLMDIFLFHSNGSDPLMNALLFIFAGYLYAADWMLMLPCAVLVVAVLSGLICLVDLTVKTLANTLSQEREHGSGTESTAESTSTAAALHRNAVPDAERGIIMSFETPRTANTSQAHSEPSPELSHEPVSTVSQAKKPSKQKPEGYGPQYLSTAFAVTNLVCAVFFYGYVYDASGTRKPTWTEMLD